MLLGLLAGLATAESGPTLIPGDAVGSDSVVHSSIDLDGHSTEAARSAPPGFETAGGTSQPVCGASRDMLSVRTDVQRKINIRGSIGGPRKTCSAFDGCRGGGDYKEKMVSVELAGAGTAALCGWHGPNASTSLGEDACAEAAKKEMCVMNECACATSESWDASGTCGADGCETLVQSRPTIEIGQGEKLLQTGARGFVRAIVDDAATPGQPSLRPGQPSLREWWCCCASAAVLLLQACGACWLLLGQRAPRSGAASGQRASKAVCPLLSKSRGSVALLLLLSALPVARAGSGEAGSGEAGSGVAQEMTTTVSDSDLMMGLACFASLTLAGLAIFLRGSIVRCLKGTSDIAVKPVSKSAANCSSKLDDVAKLDAGEAVDLRKKLAEDVKEAAKEGLDVGDEVPVTANGAFHDALHEAVPGLDSNHRDLVKRIGADGHVLVIDKETNEVFDLTYKGRRVGLDPERATYLERIQDAPRYTQEGVSNAVEDAREAAEQVVRTALTPNQETRLLGVYRTQLGSASVFVGHVRSEDNFVRGNADVVMPPAYGAERAQQLESNIALYKILFSTGRMQGALLDSFAIALISAGLKSASWLMLLAGGQYASLLAIALHHASLLLGAFRFFPAFLLLGLLSYIVARWWDWLVNAHTIQARLHDIGVSVGGAVITADAETRKLLWNLYRYLNTVHALTYQGVHPKMPKTLPGFVPLGLLTSGEVALLLPMQNKVRDTLIAWAHATIEQLVREGRVRELAIGNMMVAGLRGFCARHHDMFVRNMPNLWFALAKLLVDYLVLVHMFDLAIDNSITYDQEDEKHKVQLVMQISMTVLTGTLIASAYWLAWAVVRLLANPWDGETDSYNCDALLGSTERMLFATLRARFDADALTIASCEPAGSKDAVAGSKDAAASKGASAAPADAVAPQDATAGMRGRTRSLPNGMARTSESSRRWHG